MLSRFKKRSYELEHLDKGDYTAEEYEGCIIELQRVNRWLGDTRALKQSLLAELESLALKRFSVLDVGAGSGELLRVAASWAKENDREGSFVGLELNARSARAIRGESPPEISAVRGDTFRLPFADNAFDYTICSLFTHHFRDEDVIKILQELSRVARRRIYVIDLHRHPIAYFFYTTFGQLLLHNRLIREDGALSILRSFKPAELHQLAEEAQLQDIRLKRSFPYRIVLSARKSLVSVIGIEQKPEQSNGRMRLAS